MNEKQEKWLDVNELAKPLEKHFKASWKYMKKLLIILIPFLIFSYSEAATLRYSENFDNQTIRQPSEGSVTVYRFYPSPNWSVAVLNTDYSLNQTGRGGSGYCFTNVGTNSDAYLYWGDNMSWATTELYVSFWIKFSQWVDDPKGTANLKMFYPHFRADSGNAYVHYSLQSRGWMFYSAMNKNGVAVTKLNDYSTPSSLTDGKWHHFEFHIDFSAGRSRWWCDSTLVVDETYGSGTWNTTNPIYYIDILGMDGSPNIPNTYTRHLDDVEIWDGMPDARSARSASTASTAPQAPSGLKIVN